MDDGDREQILEALREVYDPCCEDRRLSVVDMGLIDDIRLDGECASVDLVLTSGWCPFMVPLVDTIRARVAGLESVAAADVRVVWDRAWTADRLSDTARRQLHFLPSPSQIAGDDTATPAVGASPVHASTPEVTS